MSGERISNLQTGSYFYTRQKKAYLFCTKYTSSKTVLEIGSGSGYGAFMLSKKAKNVTAIDNNHETIQKAKTLYKASNLTFIENGIESFSTQKKFDVIVSLQFIEHVYDPEMVIAKMQALLAINGTLILSTPNKLTQSYVENPYHIKEFTSEELSSLLSKQFNRVKMYGLTGSKQVSRFESEKKKRVSQILSLDIFNLRALLPRSVKQILFDFVTNRMRSQETSKSFTLSDFTIKPYAQNALDLIAVCSK